MKFNGNITLNTLGQSEIQNLVVERVSATPSFSASEAGRLVYNTTSRLYFMNSGLGWIALATGGDAAALQSEVDLIETSIGASVTASGAFNASAFTGTNILNAATLTDAINQLDASITGKNELKELLDVVVGSVTAGQFLRYDSTASKWVNHTLVLSNVTDVTASASEVNFLVGTTSSVQTQLTAESTRAIQAEADLGASILTEKNRATAAEVVLTANLATEAAALVTETNRATAAEASNAAAIVTEASARVAADIVVASNASALVSTEASQRATTDAAFTVRSDAMQAELDTTQAASGLENNGSYIAPVGSNFLGASTSLKNADVLLDDALQVEVTTRATADTAFSGALSAEVTARTNGDATLQTQLTAYINAQVAGVTAAEGAESAARIAADTAQQAEIDSIETGAGLSTAGAYVVDDSTVYLKTAVSLANADKMLDSAINAVALSLASEISSNATQDAAAVVAQTAETTARTAMDLAQQTEIDAIETGAGLQGNGTYAVNTGTNYLNAAVSLKDADFILDIAIKTEATRSTAADVAQIAALTSEVTRAEAAEAVLTANVGTEVARATAAEGVLTAAISAEVTRALAAEAILTGNVSTEVTRALAAEAAITAKVSKGYFLYDGASATSHAVPHNIGSQFCNVTVIDSATNEQIIPQSVVFNSANQLTVAFNVALACKVVVMGLGI
jgi:hypothetical protein